MFSRYVGVTPKWIIQRYRLHDAIARTESHRPTEWAQLAADLGYVDLAHFIGHFKTAMGSTPAEYARNLAGTSP